jgi:hypothetical protein
MGRRVRLFILLLLLSLLLLYAWVRDQLGGADPRGQYGAIVLVTALLVFLALLSVLLVRMAFWLIRLTRKK